MADEKPVETPAPATTDAAGNPAAEELIPESESATVAEGVSGQPLVVTEAAKRRHAAYRPSHKATFIGLAVVAIILIANGAMLSFILRSQDAAKKTQTGSVTLSSSSLDKLGVSRDTVGNEGVLLSINPATNFGNNVTISNDLTVGGQFKLNGKFTATEGVFTKLQGGDTQLDKLNVNGDATATSLNLRKDLAVLGTTKLQGQVSVSQLMSVNNNLNVTGSLTVGNTLTVQTLQVANFLASGNLTIGGHLISSGATPLVVAGSAVGSNGTVSASGNDTSGTIAVNIGVGAVSGQLATVTFRSKFASTPHVVVTPVGGPVSGMYINRTSTGFSIWTPSALPASGFAFDYIVSQ